MESGGISEVRDIKNDRKNDRKSERKNDSKNDMDFFRKGRYDINIESLRGGIAA